jgi:ribosomal-protein-alanine N-acetyltransferase
MALPTSSEYMTIRRVTTPARAVVRELECACFGRMRWLFGLWPRVGQPGVNTWIAEAAGGHPVGYLIAYPHKLDGQPVMYVGGVGVAPTYRRRGVGAQLMQALLAEHPSLWLHVRAGNTAAIALYRGLGMRERQRLSHFYSNGEDAILLETSEHGLHDLNNMHDQKTEH